MADATITAGLVRPLNGAIIRRFIASASLNIGDAVYVHTDGTVKPADADAEASAQGRGVVVSVGVGGAVAASTGDAVDVVTHGAVAGFAALTEGAVLYASSNAGKLTHTAPVAGGTYPFILGWAESDGVLYVQPQVALPVSN